MSTTHLNYIDRYINVAVSEMRRTGIPASIKMAQGILESEAGNSELARMANNHFGIKCGNNWTGATYFKKDDDYDANGNLMYSCFRSYPGVMDSYIDHSEFLRDPRKAYRYGSLFSLSPTDYRGWAYGLKQAGYATSETYPTKLIDLIERYGLHKYDIVINSPGAGQPQEPVRPQPNPNPIPIPVPSPNPTPKPGIAHYIVVKGDTLSGIARRHNVSVSVIKEANGLSSDFLQVGMQLRIPSNNAITFPPPIYTPKPKPRPEPWIGYHTVVKGDTLSSLAGRYNTSVGAIKQLNRLTSNTLYIGMKLQLPG